MIAPASREAFQPISRTKILEPVCWTPPVLFTNGRLVSLDQQGNLTVLADTYNNVRLNSPNDLRLDPKGGIYFTDPRYGREDGYQQDRQGVYYLSPDCSNLIRVNEEMDVPNGIIGSPDGKYLYVADSGKNETYVFDIKEDGTLSEKHRFAPEGIDGMAVDSEGNIYITTSHIHVYDPSGKKIQTIEVPEQPGNICFGGKDQKTLFITGTTSLYSIQMQVSGF